MLKLLEKHFFKQFLCFPKKHIFKHLLCLTSDLGRPCLWTEKGIWQRMDRLEINFNSSKNLLWVLPEKMTVFQVFVSPCIVLPSRKHQKNMIWACCGDHCFSMGSEAPINQEEFLVLYYDQSSIVCHSEKSNYFLLTCL